MILFEMNREYSQQHNLSVFDSRAAVNAVRDAIEKIHNIRQGAPSLAGVTIRVLNLDASEKDQVVALAGPDGAVAGYGARGEAPGYEKLIQVMVGMDAAAERITCVTVIDYDEMLQMSPHVAGADAAKAWPEAIAPSEETLAVMSDFVKQVRGRRVDDLHPIAGSPQDIQGVTGATITANACLAAARKAAEKIQAVVRKQQ